MARALALKVRACALCRLLLIVFDGCVAYIERLNATFRSVIASLARRTRALARTAVLLSLDFG